MVFLLSAPAFAVTNIPSQAWSRDINAGGYIDGAPIGGFGAGTVSWDFTGDYYLNRLSIGVSVFSTDANCHFYMYQKPSGQAAVMKMLNAATLGSGQASYYSLFPKSWVDYYGSDFPLESKVTQFSPITPNEYQFSSYPEGIYEWDVTNNQAVSVDYAVMLTWDNTYGGTNAAVTTSGTNTGLVLTRNNGSATNQNQGEFTLATQTGAGVSVTYESAASVATLQTAFNTAGLLSDTTGNNTVGAIAFKVTLAPGQSLKWPIVMAWDIPLAKPGSGAAWYREYTRYYGKTGLNSAAIAFDGLTNYSTWESALDSWQNSVLTGPYPDWLKQMVFNELYYYFTGGTIWEAGQYGNTTYNAGPDMFSSLESYIYDFYGTSDVRFYGSWPLALNWPNIDKQEVEQFCDSVVVSPSQPMPRPAAIGTCAHDYGDENGLFTEWNAYVYRNSTIWKDLNSKLVLMVYRAYELTGKSDTTFLNYCWPAVQAAMTDVHGQCGPDGLPTISATDANSGADCTYDDMGLNGETAYCGSLYLAACEAAQAMATAEGNNALATTYQGWLTTGQTGFATLWNGTYYNIDNGATDTAQNRIMVDQLCGQWYAKAVGLPGIVSDANANSAWQAVHDNNWSKFDGGAHGAVNSMTSAGAIDTSWSQSQEVWVGVSWGAAAGMAQQGMYSQATDLGYSLYNSIWNLGQYWFRTPEAWTTGLGGTRAPYYMRANAVWALKHAYDIGPAPCGLQTCTTTPTHSPTPTATMAPTLDPCGAALQRVNCAGTQYVAGGITWVADQAYATGSWGYVSGTAAVSITNTITGTAYPGLYQTERYGNPVEYKFTEPNGTYQVVLRFVEQHWTGANERVFSVAINGVTVISNLDIWSQVGQYAAYNQTFLVPVTGGLIDIVETSTVDNAEITGIDILNNNTACTPTMTPTGTLPTATFSPTVTPSPTITKTFTVTPTFTFTLTPTITNSPTPTATVSPTYTTNPCAAAYDLVDVGSNAAYSGTWGTWSIDQAYSPGGYGYVSAGTTAGATGTITGTTDPTLYQTERYASPLEYKFTVPNGTYLVLLKNVEMYWTAVGDRVFSVAINGVTVLNNLDIYSEVGKNVADDHSFYVTVTTGLIDIVATATADNAEFAAIGVISEAPCSPTPTPTGWNTSTPTSTATKTSTSTATSSMTSTSTSTLTNSPTATFSPTASPTNSSTQTATSTFTNTSTSTATITRTPTNTPTGTVTPVPTNTPTWSPTNTQTPTKTPTFTSTNSNTYTPTPTFTVPNTPTFTKTNTSTFTWTVTNTFTGTLVPTSTPTNTGTPTLTFTPTKTATLSFTPTFTNSFTQTLTATNTLSPTKTATPTYTGTFTWTSTATYTPTKTFTFTPTWTATKTDTITFTPTFTPTDTPSPILTATPTGVPTAIVISPPYPNPSDGTNPVTVALWLTGPSKVTWGVFTTAFRKIYEENDTLNGAAWIQWNLKDKKGSKVSAGVYYIRVEVQTGTTKTRKILKVLVLP